MIHHKNDQDALMTALKAIKKKCGIFLYYMTLYRYIYPKALKAKYGTIHNKHHIYNICAKNNAPFPIYYEYLVFIWNRLYTNHTKMTTTRSSAITLCLTHFFKISQKDGKVSVAILTNSHVKDAVSGYKVQYNWYEAHIHTLVGLKC